MKKRVTELASSAAAAAALAKEQGKKKKKILLQQDQQQQSSSSSASGGNSNPESYSDQGYCRPRVLILCPMRGTALRFIEAMMHILGENTRLFIYLIVSNVVLVVV